MKFAVVGPVQLEPITRLDVMAALAGWMRPNKRVKVSSAPALQDFQKFARAINCEDFVLEYSIMVIPGIVSWLRQQKKALPNNGEVRGLNLIESYAYPFRKKVGPTLTFRFFDRQRVTSPKMFLGTWVKVKLTYQRAFPSTNAWKRPLIGAFTKANFSNCQICRHSSEACPSKPDAGPRIQSIARSMSENRLSPSLRWGDRVF
jgi:hypothetical protein